MSDIHYGLEKNLPRAKNHPLKYSHFNSDFMDAEHAEAYGVHPSIYNQIQKNNLMAK